MGAHVGHWHRHGQEVAARFGLFWRIRVPRFIHLHASICALHGLKAFQCMFPHTIAPPPPRRLSSRPVSQEAEVEAQDGEQKLVVMFERK